MSFVDVREPHTNKLLFRFDAERDIIEVQRRGVKTLVDLYPYRYKAALERARSNEPFPPILAEDVQRRIEERRIEEGHSNCSSSKRN